MSVLIKCMEMPKCCYECVFYDDEEVFCYAVRNFVDERLVQKQRDHDCPLVEVPTPHGRLIDADVIYDTLCSECDLNGECDEPCLEIERMPTVIEADG